MIDLWTIPLDRDAARARVLLTKAERAEMRGYASADLADRFAVRRAARRMVLARYLDCAPGDLTFSAGDHGKPDLPGIAFSTSHSGGRAILAVSPAGAIGADIERIRPVDREVLSRIAAPDEDVSGPDGYLALWTAKEAVVKAMGIGLDLDLMRATVVGSQFGQWRPALTPRGHWMVRTWHEGGFMISLASAHPEAICQRDAGAVLRQAGFE